MIKLIAAIDAKRGIAKHGIMPWYIPEDEEYFTTQTKSAGGVVLMGQRTFEAIGKALEGRHNFVLSHDKHEAAGVTFIHDLDEFLSSQSGDIWVIGGADIFDQTLSRADQLYLTKIQADFNCDRFFPAYEGAFQQHLASPLQTQNGFIFTYEVWGKL